MISILFSETRLYLYEHLFNNIWKQLRFCWAMLIEIVDYVLYIFFSSRIIEVNGFSYHFLSFKNWKPAQYVLTINHSKITQYIINVFLEWIKSILGSRLRFKYLINITTSSAYHWVPIPSVFICVRSLSTTRSPRYRDNTPPYRQHLYWLISLTGPRWGFCSSLKLNKFWLTSYGSALWTPASTLELVRV